MKLLNQKLEFTLSSIHVYSNDDYECDELTLYMEVSVECVDNRIYFGYEPKSIKGSVYAIETERELNGHQVSKISETINIASYKVEVQSSEEDNLFQTSIGLEAEIYLVQKRIVIR